jgi:hypothetical protein
MNEHLLLIIGAGLCIVLLRLLVYWRRIWKADRTLFFAYSWVTENGETALSPFSSGVTASNSKMLVYVVETPPPPPGATVRVYIKKQQYRGPLRPKTLIYGRALGVSESKTVQHLCERNYRGTASGPYHSPPWYRSSVSTSVPMLLTSRGPSGNFPTRTIIGSENLMGTLCQ